MVFEALREALRRVRRGVADGRRVTDGRPVDRSRARLTALAPLDPVALDLASDFVGAEIDRVLELGRGVVCPQRHALEMEGRLGDVTVRVGRVALDEELNLQLGEFGDLP